MYFKRILGEWGKHIDVVVKLWERGYGRVGRLVVGSPWRGGGAV